MSNHKDNNPYHNPCDRRLRFLKVVHEVGLCSMMKYIAACTAVAVLYRRGAYETSRRTLEQSEATKNAILEVFDTIGLAV